MNYKQKYLKYKLKYLNLKKYGGSGLEPDDDDDLTKLLDILNKYEKEMELNIMPKLTNEDPMHEIKNHIKKYKEKLKKTEEELLDLNTQIQQQKLKKKNTTELEKKYKELFQKNHKNTVEITIIENDLRQQFGRKQDDAANREKRLTNTPATEVEEDIDTYYESDFESGSDEEIPEYIN